MAASSTFSYAQAAKGQSASPSTALPNVVSQPQGAASPVTPDTPAESLDASRPTESRTVVAVEKQDVDSNIGSESDLRSETTNDRRSELRRDDDSGRLDRPWRRTDKGTRSSSTATGSVDEQESRKPRKGKKSKASSDKQSNDQAPAADKDKETAQQAGKVELSEAPIPSINIWHQRKEQQSKAKASPSEGIPNGTTSHDGEAKKPAKDSVSANSTKENAPTNGVKSNRKNGDSARSDRNGSRGSRLAEKDTKTELPPPVEDAASWPTPEIAIKEEQKKPAATKSAPAQEKEPQDDASHNKRTKEKWVTYDYVPSVNFETQLPQMRNSKPRGGARSANSGRTAPNGAQSGDKTSAYAAPSKPVESKDRAKDNTAGANKNASLPPASKRVSVDVNTTAKEQKKTTAQSGNDKAKDVATAQSQNTNARSEGRAERGRGGYRGRGAHHAVNTHSQHQHSAAGNFSNNGSVPGRPQGPYSPPPRQGPHGQGYMAPPQRGGRGRNGAGNNFHRMSLPNGTTRIPPIQTQFGSYEYPMAPLSAMSFQQAAVWDAAFMAVLRSQIEYYFSIENLCKDMYLRQRMDSQGFVNLHFIAAFKRIRELTPDVAVVRAACEISSELDFIVGDDDIERLRRRNGWQSFILPMEDRDEFARNPGPVQVTFKNRPYNYVPQYNSAMPVPYGIAPTMGFALQGDATFQQLAESVPSGQAVNGLVNGNCHAHASSTQLSADVPDFSPSGLAGRASDALNHASEATNGLTNGIHAE
ncbi:La domain family [Metarhizium robertsii ARSEF 23]|uniref:La domain family n=1 Tax=Metarhizium robertsii (strain ARSEF 23 / ATCC MYA-3075) TaxID=655844 RepID=E9EL44_METRA|nr:La domain family [Metarhizium robertsii ARSEF 23]EFZ03111.1 La domain family [Metarhizium robertsii ARSEF 23]